MDTPGELFILGGKVDMSKKTSSAGEGEGADGQGETTAKEDEDDDDDIVIFDPNEKTSEDEVEYLLTTPSPAPALLSSYSSPPHNMYPVNDPFVISILFPTLDPSFFSTLLFFLPLTLSFSPTLCYCYHTLAVLNCYHIRPWKS